MRAKAACLAVLFLGLSLVAAATPSTEDLQSRMRTLDFGFWNTRINTLYDVGEMGLDGLPLLRYASDDADWQVRLTSVHFLGKLGPSAAQTLGEIARFERCTRVRVAALRLLAEMGDEGREILKEVKRPGDDRAMADTPDRIETERMGKTLVIDAPGGAMTRDFFHNGVDARVCSSSEHSNRRERRKVLVRLRAVARASTVPPPEPVRREPPRRAAFAAVVTPPVQVAKPVVRAPARPPESLPDAPPDSSVELIEPEVPNPRGRTNQSKKSYAVVEPTPPAVDKRLTKLDGKEASSVSAADKRSSKTNGKQVLSENAVDTLLAKPDGEDAPPAPVVDKQPAKPYGKELPPALAVEKQPAKPYGVELPSPSDIKRRLGSAEVGDARAEHSPEFFPPDGPRGERETSSPEGRFAATTERKLAASATARAPKRTAETMPAAGPGIHHEQVEQGSADLVDDAGTGKIENDPIPELIKRLSSVEPRTRARAADELGKRGQAALPAVPALRRALKDRDRRVRASAVLALGDFAGSVDGVIGELQRALHDKNEDVRFSAGIALQRLQEPPKKRRE